MDFGTRTSLRPTAAIRAIAWPPQAKSQCYDLAARTNPEKDT